MRRRDILSAGALGAAGAGLCAPALAQGAASEVRWRLSSGFPKSLDILSGAAESFARLVAETTNGRFRIEVLPAADGQGIEAVASGALDATHTAASAAAEDPAFALATAVPFGLNARQQTAWWLQGGALDLFNEIFAKRRLHALPGGNTGAQMGGWFRSEVRSVADLRGLRLRSAGLGGQVLGRLGASVQAAPGTELQARLAAKTLDAAEWIGPYDDERLGLHKAAPFYYYPGFSEGAAMLHFLFNAGRWAALSAGDRAVLRAAAASVHGEVQAKYDACNPGALRRLVGAGAQLKPFPQDVMEAALRATNEVCDGIAEANADFKRAYEALKAFRNEEYLWFQVAEYTYDNFMIRARARG